MGKTNSGSEDAKRLLETMIRIRVFEEACAEQYSAGMIRGFLHLYIGEEASATGIIDNLSDEDIIFATYREHGHALARGISAKSIMSEMFGKAEGCCRGRGGSMHLFDVKKKFYGGSAIVAGALPLAVGTALASKMQGKKQVTVCFFGEGAMAEGEFHESMNLASLWSLPILFVCENNLYAMGTSLEASESEIDLVKKASVYQIKSTTVDGMDVMEVDKSAKSALKYVRDHQKPLFLECRTFRFRAHSMFDPELYRSKKEVESWKKRDPIQLIKSRLMSEGLISMEDFDGYQKNAIEETREAIAFASMGTMEPQDQLYRFVHSEHSMENRP